jgi:putative holliday junction resolvase
MGLDYGEKRVGVAVSDPDGIIAMPYYVIEVTGEKALLAEIKKVCEATNAEAIVVGLPINMNGTAGPMAEKVGKFVEKLAELTDLPVEKWDERLTTSMAERSLLEADMSRAKRKKVRDMISAQIILQSYLDMTNTTHHGNDRT